MCFHNLSLLEIWLAFSAAWWKLSQSRRGPSSPPSWRSSPPTWTLKWLQGTLVDNTVIFAINVIKSKSEKFTWIILYQLQTRNIIFSFLCGPFTYQCIAVEAGERSSSSPTIWTLLVFRLQAAICILCWKSARNSDKFSCKWGSFSA